MRDIGLERTSGARSAIMAHHKRACSFSGKGDDLCPRHHSKAYWERRRREEREHQRAGGQLSNDRSAPVVLQARDVDELSLVAREVTDAAKMLAAQTVRPKLDGRQVIADRKRERRKLIVKAARYGINEL